MDGYVWLSITVETAASHIHTLPRYTNPIPVPASAFNWAGVAQMF